ncbi:MAG: trypsin-like serine protease [Deltaproteobacteria bacterium]|nr:trypsin-like serine protease [Deltaproteobacteria bacterium]
MALGCAAELEDEQEAVGSSNQAILNGDAISVGQFPTVVGVVVGQGGLCTGTLVTDKVVITAAHCISPNVMGGTQEQITAATQVVFDSTNVFSGQGFAVRAERTLPVPSFTQPGNPDIGIVWLEQAITDREPSPLNTDSENAGPNTRVTMVGYGLNEDGGSGGGFFLTDRQATSCASYGVSDQMFMCFSQTNGIGKCSGDSGGPSFGYIDGVEALVGVTSFGDQNCQFFGADFRVDAARAFLQENIPEAFCIDDGLCDEACGSDGSAADPDCKPACVANSDCEGDSYCNADGACEPAPFSPGGLGADCGDGLPECVTGQCATGADGSYCSTDCASDDGCPDGFDCIQVAGGGGACWPEDGGGCRTGSSPTPFGAAVLFIFGFLALRRRRS